MISFIILLLFTLIVSPVLYFYPPNIPLKIKMTLLGIAFLLALGGLFVFDILSYWLSVAAIVAIAFIASYLAEKRLDLIDTNGEKTEIILSFSDEVESVDFKKETYISDMDSSQDVESAVTLEELPVETEIQKLPIEVEVLNEQTIEELTLEKAEELEVLQELELEVIEPQEEEHEVLLEANEIEEIQEVIAPIEDLTEEEFAFLTEGREIILEEGIDSSIPTDITDEDMFNQRSALLDELEELEETTAVVESSSEILDAEEKEEVEIFENFEDVKEVEEVEHEIIEIQQEEILLADSLPVDATEGTVDESIVLHEELLPEIDMDELEVISEKEELDAFMVIPEQTEVLDDANATLVEKEELVAETDHAEHVVEEPEHHEEATQASHELLTNEEMPEEEVAVEEAISVEQNDMDVDVQDMLLNTLTFYEAQGDTESYEDMLQSILTQYLSNKDYYLFSKLLLESYITRNNIESSQSTLDRMRERLVSYPVIMEEIDRYAGSLIVEK